MKDIMHFFFRQIESRVFFKKLFQSILSITVLTSCSVGGSNSFTNSSDHNNLQYRSLDKNLLQRRIPQGNNPYLATESNINDVSEVQYDEEKYQDKEVSNFWAGVYSDPKPVTLKKDKDNKAIEIAHDTVIANKIEKVAIKELKKDLPCKKANAKNVTPRFTKDQKLQDVIDFKEEPNIEMALLPNEEEKVLNELKFLNNSTEITSSKNTENNTSNNNKYKSKEEKEYRKIKRF